MKAAFESVAKISFDTLSLNIQLSFLFIAMWVKLLDPVFKKLGGLSDEEKGSEI